MSFLELLDAPGIYSTAQLAADLNTTPEMVEAKLERYAQPGYVKKTVMSADCGGNCKKMPRIKAKRLSASIGSLTMEIGGMRCENCQRSVTAALNALDSVAAKASLESGTASVSFERPVSDEELTQAVESVGFDVLDIRH